MLVVAEYLWYICQSSARLLAFNCRRFEAICHKFHCKRPFKKPLLKGRKGLLQRHSSQKPCEQLTKGNKVCLAYP